MPRERFPHINKRVVNAYCHIFYQPERIIVCSVMPHIEIAVSEDSLNGGRVADVGGGGFRYLWQQ